MVAQWRALKASAAMSGFLKGRSVGSLAQHDQTRRLKSTPPTHARGVPLSQSKATSAPRVFETSSDERAGARAVIAWTPARSADWAGAGAGDQCSKTSTPSSRASPPGNAL